MEPTETPLIEHDPPVQTVYVFRSKVAETTLEWFRLEDLQGKFWCKHHLSEGEDVKVVIEAMPYVYTDNDNQNE